MSEVEILEERRREGKPPKSRDEVQVEASSWRIWGWVREHRHSLDSHGAATMIQRHMRHAIHRIARQRDMVEERLDKTARDRDLWKQTAKEIEKMMFATEAKFVTEDEKRVKKVTQMEKVVEELGRAAIAGVDELKKLDSPVAIRVRLRKAAREAFKVVAACDDGVSLEPKETDMVAFNRKPVQECVNPDPPTDCIRRIVDLYKAGDFGLEMASHVAAVVAWVFAWAGGTLEPQPFGASQEAKNELYEALADLDAQIAGTDTVAFNGPITDVIISRLLTEIINQIIAQLSDNGPAWVTAALDMLLDLLDGKS